MPFQKSREPFLDYWLIFRISRVLKVVTCQKFISDKTKRSFINTKAYESLSYQLLFAYHFEYVNNASYKSRCMQMQKIFMLSIKTNTNHALNASNSNSCRYGEQNSEQINFHIDEKQSAPDLELQPIVYTLHACLISDTKRILAYLGKLIYTIIVLFIFFLNFIICIYRHILCSNCIT